MYALRLPQRNLREILERRNPISPLRLTRKPIQLLNQRQRELSKLLQPSQPELQRGAPLRFGFGKLEDLCLNLGAQTSQAALPTLQAANHCSVDENLFPTVRRNRRGCIIGSVFHRRLQTLKGGNHFVLRRFETVSRRRGAIRNLGQRQILGKAGCGIILGGTLQQCQESSPRGVRPQSPMRKPAGTSRASQRFFYQGLIAVGIAKDDGHPVESDALLDIAHGAAGDLRTLETLARRGEAFHGVIQRSLRRRLGREEKISHTLDGGLSLGRGRSIGDHFQ